MKEKGFQVLSNKEDIRYQLIYTIVLEQELFWFFR